MGYTITVTNTGQTPYAGAGLTDPLSGVLDDAIYNNDAAAVTRRDRVLRQLDGDLDRGPGPGGAAAVITFSVTVNNPDTGNRALTTTVASPRRAATARPAPATPLLRHRHRGQRRHPDLHRGRRAPSPVAGRGGELHNHHRQLRPSPYTGATFAVPLSGVLDDAA